MMMYSLHLLTCLVSELLWFGLWGIVFAIQISPYTRHASLVWQKYKHDIIRYNMRMQSSKKTEHKVIYHVCKRQGIIFFQGSLLLQDFYQRDHYLILKKIQYHTKGGLL